MSGLRDGQNHLIDSLYDVCHDLELTWKSRPQVRLVCQELLLLKTTHEAFTTTKRIQIEGESTPKLLKLLSPSHLQSVQDGLNTLADTAIEEGTYKILYDDWGSNGRLGLLKVIHQSYIHRAKVISFTIFNTAGAG